MKKRGGRRRLKCKKMCNVPYNAPYNMPSNNNGANCNGTKKDLIL
jgi:hypothetical protein